MLRLRTFGELTVWRDGESAPIRSVQRRSLTLLAILASSRSSGVSREKVISILWPESDAESAKASLRQAVFATRRELGSDDIIVGSNELSLNPTAITSDVGEFASALTAKEYERAAELYQGPFLAGVQARSLASFERWVESQRSLLGGEYKRALEELASTASSHGESLRALDWWRKLAADDPLSSRSAAGLMEALIAVGDSGAALSHYRVYESMVRDELSSAPDAAVSLVAKRAREPALGVAPVESAQSGPPPDPMREKRATRAWTDRRLPLTGAAIVGASVLMGLAFTVHSRREPESARRIVIVPFENKTGDRQLDALGTMTSDWITDGLSRTGLISIIDPGTAFFAARDAQERTGSISGNFSAVRAISIATDADIVTTGDYFRKGDSLEFHARITNARRDRLIASMEPLMVALGSPTDAVQAVRQRVLGVLARELDPRLSEVIEAQSTPPTFDAYRAYTLGLQFFAHQANRDAAVQFRRAYQIDTSFAGALLWTIQADGGMESRSVASGALLDTLLLKRDRLTPLDRYAVDALHAYYEGWIDSSIVAAKAAAAIAPKSQWVWNAAVWSTYANRPHEAVSLLESLDPMRGWLKGWGRYWRVLAGMQHSAGDFKGERQTIERGLQVAPDDKRLREWAIISLAAQNRIDELNGYATELLASSDSNSTQVISQLLFELRAHGHVADADRLFARAAPNYASKWAGTAAGRRGFGNLLFTNERWKEARSQLQLAARDYAVPQKYGILGELGVCAAVLGDTTTALAIADSLGRFTGLLKPNAIYWKAIVVARLRRRAEAVALLRQAYALGWPKASPYGHSLRQRFPDLFGYPPFEEFFKSD